MKKISMLFAAAVVAVAFAGCNKGAGGPSCDEVNTAVTNATKKMGEAKDAPPEMKKATEKMASSFGAMAAKHCKDDKWSAEAVKCVGSVKEQQDYEKCESMLSKEQQQKLEDEMKKVMMESMGGAAGGEMPPPPPAGEPPPAGGEPAAAAGGGTGVPECDAYVAAIEKFMTCDKVPQAARDAQKQSLDAMKQGWASLSDPAATPEAKKAAGDGCKTALDGLAQAAKGAGCAP